MEMGSVKLPDPKPGSTQMLWILALILLGTSIYLYACGRIVTFAT